MPAAGKPCTRPASWRGQPPIADARLAEALASRPGGLATAISNAGVDPDEFCAAWFRWPPRPNRIATWPPRRFFRFATSPGRRGCRGTGRAFRAVREAVEGQTADATRELELRSGPLTRAVGSPRPGAAGRDRPGDRNAPCGSTPRWPFRCSQFVAAAATLTRHRRASRSRPCSRIPIPNCPRSCGWAG